MIEQVVEKVPLPQGFESGPDYANSRPSFKGKKNNKPSNSNRSSKPSRSNSDSNNREIRFKQHRKGPDIDKS